MNKLDKYHYIMESAMKMVPDNITGVKRRNTRSNIKLYVQRQLGMSNANPNLRAVVHLGVRIEVDRLLKELE